ncbi:hypothetical protein LUZ60_009342 [Juncus effusus]|nr:hypothetical protein LUZ60_009342 [Juncus effusus]
MEHAIPKRIWHIIQAVYYILRKGLSKKKLVMDLQLLLKRGKLAGKSLTHLLTFHHNGHPSSHSASSCLSLGSNLSFYTAKDVEFSCSNTPAESSFPSFHLPKRGKRHNKHDSFGEFDAETIAKAFQILNSGTTDVDIAAALATPSPMLMLGFGKSPAIIRQLRVTDSPFPIQEAGQSNGFVDKEADAFIKRFYEQLRHQQSLAATPTPEYNISNRRGCRGARS